MRIFKEDLRRLEEIRDIECELYNNEELTEEDVENLKSKAEDLFNEIGILQQSEISKSEIDLGNVIIDKDTLYCIYNNNIHKFNMIKRRAKVGDLVYILEADDYVPFNKNYINTCFMVDGEGSEYDEMITSHVIIGEGYGWCLYDYQYVVLEEIK